MQTINNTMSTVSNIASTLFNFATHDWSKKELIRLAVIGGIFITATAVVKIIDTKYPEIK